MINVNLEIILKWCECNNLAQDRDNGLNTLNRVNNGHVP